jgi:hypothetical protein
MGMGATGDLVYFRFVSAGVGSFGGTVRPVKIGVLNTVEEGWRVATGGEVERICLWE